jgi:hypothetical protein
MAIHSRPVSNELSKPFSPGDIAISSGMAKSPTPDERVRTLISLTRPQHDWLRTRAFERRTSITGEIREFVQRAMDSEARPPSRTARKGQS